jgi:FixJ family two-component response regulator
MNDEEREKIISETSEKYPVKIFRVHGLDDDEIVRQKTKQIFEMSNLTFEFFDDGADFMDKLSLMPEMCFVDYKIDGFHLNGNQITRTIVDTIPGCLVTMITGNKDRAVMKEFFTKSGGYDFIDKGNNYDWVDDELVPSLQKQILVIKQRLAEKAEIEQWRESYNNRKKRIAKRDEKIMATNNQYGAD